MDAATAPPVAALTPQAPPKLRDRSSDFRCVATDMTHDGFALWTSALRRLESPTGSRRLANCRPLQVFASVLYTYQGRQPGLLDDLKAVIDA